jgi:tetratricopeptide (TPR) repeat protein
MMDITQTLNEVIGRHLNQYEMDLIGIVPFTTEGDRMVRLRTLEEMFEEFADSSGKGAVGYFLQVQPRIASAKTVGDLPVPLSTNLESESVYLTDGKLNITYLIKNADLLFDAGDYGLARNIYTAILLAGDSTGPIHFRLGRCFEAEGKLNEARSQYEKSVAYSPTLETYQRMGALLVRQNKDREGAEVFERALNLKDLSKSVRFELHKSCGNCWTRAQKTEEAERHFKLALELIPSADEIRANLGALYLQRNDVHQAKRNFTDALASNSNNHHALAGLGSCFMAQGDFKTAHDYFTQSLDIQLNHPTALFYLVKCAYEIKTYAIAARFLENYIQVAPINPTLLYSLAGLQMHLGKFTEARDTALRVLELQPQHSGTKELLEILERYTGKSSR